MSTTESVRGARVVVIGLGNPIMGDDGFGLAVLRRLRRDWRFRGPVELVDGGVWGLSLLPIIECADRLLLLDAIRFGGAPGAATRLEGGEVPRRLAVKLSPHQVDVAELVALAQFRGTLPRELIALGVEPACVELRDGLSAEAGDAVEIVVGQAVDQLRVWGIQCEPANDRVASCTR